MKGIQVITILVASTVVAMVFGSRLPSEGAAMFVGILAGALLVPPIAIVVSWLRGDQPGAQRERVPHRPVMTPIEVAPEMRGMAAGLSRSAWLPEACPHLPPPLVFPAFALEAPAAPQPIRAARIFTVVGVGEDGLEAVDLDEMWFE